jgi:hypothetical protein
VVLVVALAAVSTEKLQKIEKNSFTFLYLYSIMITLIKEENGVERPI